MEAINTSLDLGITTIDTAPIYGEGLSEELIGRAIKGRTEGVVIATKCGIRTDTSEGAPWKVRKVDGVLLQLRINTTPESIFTEWERSAKRLGVDVIDLYQIHWPSDTTPVEESWSAMVSLKKQGKVRAIGVSNYNLAQLKKAHALYPVDSLQSPFSLVRRDIEKELIPFCRKEGIAVLGYSPLERGLLTGHIGMDHPFPPGDLRPEKEIFEKNNRHLVLEALSLLKPLAKKYQVSLAELIIQATIAHPGITAALVGARNLEQASQNAAALQLVLTADERAFIESTLLKTPLKLS